MLVRPTTPRPFIPFFSFAPPLGRIICGAKAHGSLYASPAPKLLASTPPPSAARQKRLNVDPSSSTLLPRQISSNLHLLTLSSLLRPPSLLPRRLRSPKPQTAHPIVTLALAAPFSPTCFFFATCIRFLLRDIFTTVRFASRQLTASICRLF